jgi:hypothetical protein
MASVVVMAASYAFRWARCKGRYDLFFRSMKLRQIIVICCLLPAGYELLSGNRQTRFVAGAALAVFALAVLFERWAAANPHSSAARPLFRGRVVTLAAAGGTTLVPAAIYLAVVAFAIHFNRLDDPVLLTIAFFAVFLAMMALAATIVLGVQRLRRRDSEIGPSIETDTTGLIQDPNEPQGV